MNKIVFVADFFSEQIQGGAEICDEILINTLKEKQIKVVKFNSREFTEKHISLYLKTGFNFLISNFVQLSPMAKQFLQAHPDRYCIMLRFFQKT